jgi:hypothetical protein
MHSSGDTERAGHHAASSYSSETEIPLHHRLFRHTGELERELDVRHCPWCNQPALKDNLCNHVVCGRDAKGFHVHAGCGRQWCFYCGLKLCGRVYDEVGNRIDGVSEHHRDGQHRPTETDPCSGDEYCGGGHNSHK